MQLRLSTYGVVMSHSFYPFVENQGDSTAFARAQEPGEDQLQKGASIPPSSPSTQTTSSKALVPQYAARIAVFDSVTAAPRVIVIEPSDVRDYLEEITREVTRLSQEVGGTIPFMVIREIVENFIHAYFIEPIISIIDHGQTIRFSDQGPGIKEKEKALDFGTTSATKEMKRYIRGVGSGLPYVKEYMKTTQGYLEVEDNISGGTIVTISALPKPVQKEIFSQTPAYPNQISTQMAQAATVGATFGEVHEYAKAQMPATQQRPVQAQTQSRLQTQPPVSTPALSQLFSQLNDRQKQIIEAIKSHGSIGPTELMRMFGLSQPTWSRELKSLEDLGLIHKNSGEQKRTFTELAIIYIQSIG